MGIEGVEGSGEEGAARAVWSGKDEGFVRVPRDDELRDALDADTTYVHITSNETIHGVEFPATPAVPPGVPLIADSSSDFLSLRLGEFASHALMYAGAQKNAGPAGVTVVIVQDDMLGRIPDRLPTIMDYRTYVENGSMYNTPPVFAIYVLMLVTRWLKDDVEGCRSSSSTIERRRRWSTTRSTGATGSTLDMPNQDRAR